MPNGWWTIVHEPISQRLLAELRKRLKEADIGHRAFEDALGLKANATKGLLDKNMRVPSVDRAQEIAAALGLEFYLGPPRSDELREAAAAFAGKQDDKGWVPLHPSQSGLTGTPQVIDRIHLPETWFKNADLDPNNAALVYLDDDGMVPTLPSGATVIIDTADTTPTAAPEIRAYQVGSTVRVRRLELSDQWLTVRPDNPRHMSETFARRYKGIITILGKARGIIANI